MSSDATEHLETTPIELGNVDLPTGVLVLLDPGLGRFWRHDGDPKSPRKTDAPEVDLEITGPDAEAAGRAYNRQFDPMFLFDIPRDSVDASIARFTGFCAEKRFDASAAARGERVAHTERTKHALAAGDGLGVVQYNQNWAVA